MRAAAALALLALLPLLAGCAGPDAAPPPPEPSPNVVTSPGDYANATADGAHIHDYWGGGDRVVVADLSHPGGDERGTGPGLAGGEDVEVRSFQPESGHVVPQGTASVEVTFTWTDAPLDSYRDPTLWVRTAAWNESREVGPVASGQAVVLPIGAEDADLPHQLLSAWLFELRMSSPDPMPLRFKGAVSLHAEAVRGLPLPVYPPHPDPWQGATELPLFAASGTLSYVEDLGDAGCNGLSCPRLLRPDDGRTVPASASRVRVVLESTDPRGLELHYHSALHRDLVRAEPLLVDAGTATYEIPVEGGGDGPYAAQSQWEFTVLPPTVGPVRTAWNAEYTVAATVLR